MIVKHPVFQLTVTPIYVSEIDPKLSDHEEHEILRESVSI